MHKETIPMNRSHLTRFILFIGCLVILLIISFDIHAATITGKVVDEEDKPIQDIEVSIKSFKGIFPPGRHNMNRHEPIFPPPPPSITDATGAFTIENLVAPSTNKLKLFPEQDPDYEIRSIEMQGIQFIMHPHQYSWREGFPFGIEEETDKIDVRFIVRKRMRIRGQVLAADGTPLSNARVEMLVKSRSIKGSGSGSSSGINTLDENGSFTRFINSPAYYTVSVTYQGQTAESAEILLEQGQRLDGLSITLPNNPHKDKVAEIVKQQAIAPPEPNRMRDLFMIRRNGIWAINPANRHAYKKIHCESPEEAIEIAKAQKAHLVAINDKEEQQWILDVFSKDNYWIGYTDDGKENAVKWDNGDPFTYTNWDTDKLISDPDTSPDTVVIPSKRHAVLIGVTGKWQRIRAHSPVASITEKAILEKKDLIIGAPQPDTNLE